ncbi:hypothetical protein MKW92_020202 [Papaver armeniacum]|nr:hypothetical protein MKW92_020202 [Papaver armeniacum]
MRTETQTSSAYKEYIAGLSGGLATVAVGHPFDTVKVKGLYRGATSSFLGMAFEGSISFGLYSQLKQSLQGELNSSKPQLQAIIPAAASVGSIISFILCPSELVKCRMQVQGTDSLISRNDRYSSTLDCISKTYKNEGVKGIFRGGSATFLRESVGNSVFFSCYEYSRYYMRLQLDSSLSGHRDQQLKVLTDVGVGIVSGGVAGVAFWLTVLPVDIYRKTGFRGCYAGLGPTLARAFPANAAAIVSWELTAKLLGIRPDRD